MVKVHPWDGISCGKLVSFVVVVLLIIKQEITNCQSTHPFLRNGNTKTAWNKLLQEEKWDISTEQKQKHSR